MRGVLGITIGDKVGNTNTYKHTYRDFGLLMTDRKIGRAALKKKQIDVPWRDGVLEYTQVGGRTYYDNRPLSYTFKIQDEENYQRIHSDFSEYAHGKILRIKDDDYPDYYFYGMCDVGDLSKDKKNRKFTLNVDAEPYRYSFASSTEDILWDDVHFPTTVFRQIGTNGVLTITDSAEITIIKGGREVVPVFTVSNNQAAITLKKYIGASLKKTVTLNTGRNRFPDLTVCGTSDVKLQFTGSGTVKIEYKEARL